MISSNQCSDTIGKKRTNTLALIRTVRRLKHRIVKAFNSVRTNRSTPRSTLSIFSIIPPRHFPSMRSGRKSAIWGTYAIKTVMIMMPTR
jgi:hypothetical protein